MTQLSKQATRPTACRRSAGCGQQEDTRRPTLAAMNGDGSGVLAPCSRWREMRRCCVKTGEGRREDDEREGKVAARVIRRGCAAGQDGLG